MNSYNFNLSYSVLYLILFFIISIAISYYSYRNTIPVISNNKKYLLISLRSLALMILFLILFEPILNLTQILNKEEKIAVFIDNSKSVSIKNSRRDNQKLMQDLLKNSQLKDIDNIDYFSFGREVLKINDLDSLKFDEELTNFENIFNKLYDLEDNYSSVVIFSDGNFNKGKNPLYLINKSESKIFTVNTSDTNVVKDISIKSFISNDIAYKNSLLPIQVSFNIDGYDLDSIKLNFYENEKLILSKSQKIFKDKNSYNDIVYLKMENSGTNKISVKINNFEDEESYLNNYKTTIVKVLESKKNISLLAGAPSSDVSIVAKFLSEQDIKLNKFIGKKNSEFYITPKQSDLFESQLFVFVGFPNKITPDNLLNDISKELKKGKPFLLIFSQDIDQKKLSLLGEDIPFTFLSYSNKEFDSQISVVNTEVSNSILKINADEKDKSIWNNASPLIKTESFLKLKPGAKSLLNMSINSSEINEPILIQNEFDGRKSIVSTAYGFFRWKLGDFAMNLNKEENYDLTNIFLENSFKWLSLKNIDKKFTIKTNQKVFSSGEKVYLSAELYDDSYNKVNNAKIICKLKNDTILREILLNETQVGTYTADIDGLNNGDWQVEGFAYINDKLIAKDNNRFLIEKSNIEYSEIKSNHKLLQEMANLSGAKFYNFNNINELKNDLSNESSKKSNLYEETQNILIWNQYWLLILVIVLFSIEWFLRKRFGMI